MEPRPRSQVPPGSAPPPRAEPAADRCPTLQDIANEVGLSRAAVSMALRGDRSIPIATRERIERAAKDLGYRPNPLVASLMSLQRRRRSAAGLRTTIAFLSCQDWRGIPSYQAMFAGARERAAEVHCLLEEFKLRTPGMTPQRMRKIIDTRGIHTVIVAPMPYGERTLDFDFSSMIAVGLGMSLITPLLERVANDHYQSAILAVEKCMALGYKRIGLIVSESSSRRLDHRWLGGYHFALHRAGMPILPPLSPAAVEDIPDAFPAWNTLYQPDVVISGHEIVHRPIFDRIPRSLGVVLLATPTADSPWTGIHQNFHLIGRMAAERAISRLYTNNFDHVQQAYLHLIAGDWVPGLSAPGPGRLRPPEVS